MTAPKSGDKGPSTGSTGRGASEGSPLHVPDGMSRANADRDQAGRECRAALPAHASGTFCAAQGVKPRLLAEIDAACES